MKGAEPELTPEAQHLIANYLDALQERLIVPPAQQRRILEETQDHLYEASFASMLDGDEASTAVQQAIADFGAPTEIARRFRPSLLQSIGAVFEPAVARTIVRGGFLLGGISLVAIGVSGLLAWLFGSLWGESFVAADFNGVTYTTERCAQFMALVPDAQSCTQAATAHHYGETVDGRLSVGLLGLVICGCYALWARHSRQPGPPSLLIGGIGVAGFGIASLVLAMSVLNLTIQHADGTGAYISAILVSSVMTVAFLPSLGRGLRTARATT